MCGVLGAVGKFEKPSFEVGLSRLSHRGPDGFGIWGNPENSILLGHRRLAIIDLTDLGRQPMVDEELVITYNGEIYNYKEIRRVLESHGHLFSSNSDTEVILKSYRQWGPGCLEKFNGMWSFAIWDSRKNEIFISRDRFGVKPMFYAFTRNGFVFGSEMKALAPLLDEIRVSPDFNWCKENIYEYETTEKTLLNGISRFPAGSFAYLRLGDNKLKPQQFWNTLDHINSVESSYSNQVEHFRELFFDSCKIRMRSDVRIGTALSGGLDSSSVAAAMHFMGGQRTKDSGMAADWQNAFVATFPGTILDEKEYAQEVVNSLQLKGYFYDIDATKGISNLSEYLWLFEELFLTSPIPMVEIYKAIRSNGIYVSLDGHGADELFSGYGTMIFNAVKDAPFDFPGIKEIATIYKEIRGLDKTDLEVVVDGFGGRKNLLKFYMNKMLNREKLRDELVEQLGFFNAALYREFHQYILPTLLRNYDRYSMSAGVEVRMPFMDYRIVSYCFSLPWQSKLRKGFTKAILRDAIEPFLSKKIVRRKTKVGFGTPFTDWLRGPWKEYICDIINSNSFINSDMIDVRNVTMSINDFYANPAPSFEDGHRVWEKLMPYLWEVNFFQRLKA